METYDYDFDFDAADARIEALREHDDQLREDAIRELRDDDAEFARKYRVFQWLSERWDGLTPATRADVEQLGSWIDDAISEMVDALRDEERERTDPYRYYGVSRRDFV